METILYNTILGARPIQPSGVSFYYADYSNDAAKSDYEQKWPCCSGTFPQLTADYGISSYFTAPTGVAVNLYHPSRVTWKQGSASLTLTQRTAYPLNGDISLELTASTPQRFTLSLRIPAWAGPGSHVLINGRPSDATSATPQPGSFYKIDRTWRSGDRVELSLDMPLRLIPLDDAHPNFVALARGPVVLFAVLPAPEKFAKAQLLAAKPRSTSSTDHTVTIPNSDPIILRSYADLTTEHYRLYHSLT